MSGERPKSPKSPESPERPSQPPSWFIRLAWAVHRATYRITGGRRGLWKPNPLDGVEWRQIDVLHSCT